MPDFPSFENDIWAKRTCCTYWIEKCRAAFDAGAVNALRELYIAARYNEKANREDARLAKKLYTDIKKSAESSETGKSSF